VLILLGLGALLSGYALFLRVSPSMSYWNFLLPTMILLGIGFALCFPSVNMQATAGIADSEQGLASGLVNTSIQIGGAVVLAAITAILSGGSNSATRPGELLPGMTTAIAVVVGVSALGVVMTLIRLAPRLAARRVVEPASVTAGAAGAELCEAC
jgi:hypothetical protein